MGNAVNNKNSSVKNTKIVVPYKAYRQLLESTKNAINHLQNLS